MKPEDTMQTIKSNFESTNKDKNNSSFSSSLSNSMNDSLGYSMTDMSPRDLAKMRKEEKSRKEA